MGKSPAGLYIHIPFCRSKCPYCDFYSMRPEHGAEDEYTNALIECIEKQADKYSSRSFDTLYIGGGTPSLLGAERLTKIAEAALTKFNFQSGAEVTVECNPIDASKYELDFSALRSAGVNRISMGLQSADEKERRTLGRLSGSQQCKTAVERALAAGIDNISLDLMLAVPGQSIQSIIDSIRFCAASGARHISAYLLKIEQGTRFYDIKDKLSLPDEDLTCEMYLAACEELEKSGFYQYEISNFSQKGCESRHNLKYWDCGEYLGLGPSAHSFMDGKRFYYPRDIGKFMDGGGTVPDGEGGSLEEYAMLRLRLVEGLEFKAVTERFGVDIAHGTLKKAQPLINAGLVTADSGHISLTKEGFLVSNAVISELIL